MMQRMEQERLEGDGALAIDKGVQLHRQVSRAQFLLNVLEGDREALKVGLLLGHGLGLVEERLLRRMQSLLDKLLLQQLLTMLLLKRVMLQTCLLHISLQSLGEGSQPLHGHVFFLPSCLILDGF